MRGYTDLIEMDLTILQQRQNDCCINRLQTRVTGFDIAMRRISTPELQYGDMQMCLAHGQTGFYLKHTGLTCYLRHIRALKDDCISLSAYLKQEVQGGPQECKCSDQEFIEHSSLFAIRKKKDTRIRQDSFQRSASAADTAGKNGQTSIYLYHIWDNKYYYFSPETLCPDIILATKLLLLCKTKS